jgi:hypothetical protein
MVPASRALLTALALAVASSLAGGPAAAGIRDMVKSAKDKATKPTGQKPAQQVGQAIEFDDTMVELTGDVLDKLIAARKATAATTQGRPAMATRWTAIPEEINVLSGKHGGEISENYNKRSEVESCISGALQEIRSQRFEAEQRRIIANPASAEKLLKLTVALNDAQIKGDQAAVDRLTRELEALYAPTRADTLAAMKNCGPMPPVHPAKVKIDALENEHAELGEKLRDMDSKALASQSKKTGMPEGQIAMAWERIERYLMKLAYSPTPGGFSSTELQALGERKDALEAALAG